MALALRREAGLELAEAALVPALEVLQALVALGHLDLLPEPFAYFQIGSLLHKCNPGKLMI